VFLVETQVSGLPTEVSFKGGSHLGNPIPTFFLASPISGTRFFLRVVVCNIPRFYQILGEFFCFYLSVLIGNSQGFKTFEFIIKAIFLKTISNFLSFHEGLLREKPRIQNILSYIFILTYASLCLQRNEFQKYLKSVYLSKLK
jgi:hypothetical protein